MDRKKWVLKINNVTTKLWLYIARWSHCDGMPWRHVLPLLCINYTMCPRDRLPLHIFSPLPNFESSVDNNNNRRGRRRRRRKKTRVKTMLVLEALFPLNFNFTLFTVKRFWCLINQILINKNCITRDKIIHSTTDQVNIQSLNFLSIKLFLNFNKPKNLLVI